MNTALAQLVEEEIALKQEEIHLARRSNITFTKFTRPDYEVNWHHQLVAAALDRVLEGKCRRLMIFEPPQNGKSEQVSRRFPAYAFGKRPDLRIIACSYNMSLAQDMSRDVQKIMSSPEYRALFPGVRLGEPSDSEKRTQGQFDIVGHSGKYLAAGMDGGITGKTADIGIIDDPIKNREEAESETYRNRLWSTYTSAFATRQFGTAGAIILCQTRWHKDDLAGRLLKLAEDNPEADQWEVISLPAIAVQERGSYDLREVGEPLWPEKYPLAELRRRKAGMMQYDWSALYQQTPAPPGGGLFKKEWFAGKFVDAIPSRMRVVRAWDTAATEEDRKAEGSDPDYTCGVKLGEEFEYQTIPHHGAVSTTDLVSTGRFFILDVQRERLGPDGVDKLIRVTAETDGVETPVREEREGGSAGPAVIAARTKTLRGFDYAEMPITGRSKVTRSKPFRAQCEAGNVYLLRAPWNHEYLDELASFPTGAHDDQVDASSAAFNAVLLEPAPVSSRGAVWRRQR